MNAIWHISANLCQRNVHALNGAEWNWEADWGTKRPRAAK